MLEYTETFNLLIQYDPSRASTDEEKRFWYHFGLNDRMQERVYNGNYTTFHDLVSAAIMLDSFRIGAEREEKEEGKRKSCEMESLSQLPRKVRLIRRIIRHIVLPAQQPLAPVASPQNQCPSPL